jgi:hypothetical protein
MSLTAAQRRALAMLATSGHNGATQALLSAHGFDASMIAELVNHGLAILTAESWSRSADSDEVARGSEMMPPGPAIISREHSAALVKSRS